MKDKILNALKQEYAHLGLGDGILSGLAEMLAGTKLVTDENLQGIVAGQKAYLEDLQKVKCRFVTALLYAGSLLFIRELSDALCHFLRSITADSGASIMLSLYPFAKQCSLRQFEPL